MVIGHARQWDYLIKTAELGKVPHALLFFGPEKIGKKTIAIEFIKFLNCLNKTKTDKQPCHSCHNCRAIEKGIFPDLNVVNLDDGKKDIQINQIRGLIKNLSLKPYSSPFKSAIIDNASLMSKASQNSFLKFLEEPGGQALLILITDSPERLLPTVLSRLQKIKFSLVSQREIKNYLINKGISKEKAEEISFFSFGQVGQAIDFYYNPEKLNQKKRLIADFLKISKSNLSFRFKYVKNISDLDSNKLKHILEVWLSYLQLSLVSQLKKKKGKNLGIFLYLK